MEHTDEALALLEFERISAGIAAADRMVKRAPIALLRCGTVHPGRYLVLVGGTVASTEEAWREGLAAGDAADSVFLADPHPDLQRAIRGKLDRPGPEVSLGVVETAGSPALLRAVDAALKAVPVALGELRLADDLGGRGFALFHGEQADVEAALATAAGAAASAAGAREEPLLATTLLRRLDGDLAGLLGEGTTFRDCALHVPAGAERAVHLTGGGG